MCDLVPTQARQSCGEEHGREHPINETSHKWIFTLKHKLNFKFWRYDMCNLIDGAKHIRILLMEVREEQICCMCWLVKKFCWVKHLNRQC